MCMSVCMYVCGTGLFFSRKTRQMKTTNKISELKEIPPLRVLCSDSLSESLLCRHNIQHDDKTFYLVAESREHVTLHTCIHAYIHA